MGPDQHDCAMDNLPKFHVRDAVSTWVDHLFVHRLGTCVN